MFAKLKYVAGAKPGKATKRPLNETPTEKARQEKRQKYEKESVFFLAEY